MKRIRWNDLLVAASLIRIGQELGMDSALARSVYGIVSAILSVSAHTN